MEGPALQGFQSHMPPLLSVLDDLLERAMVASFCARQTESIMQKAQVLQVRTGIHQHAIVVQSCHYVLLFQGARELEGLLHFRGERTLEEGCGIDHCLYFVLEQGSDDIHALLFAVLGWFHQQVVLVLVQETKCVLQEGHEMIWKHLVSANCIEIAHNCRNTQE